MKLIEPVVPKVLELMSQSITLHAEERQLLTGSKFDNFIAVA